MSDTAAARAHRSASSVATLRFISSFDDPVVNPDRRRAPFSVGRCAPPSGSRPCAGRSAVACDDDSRAPSSTRRPAPGTSIASSTSASPTESTRSRSSASATTRVRGASTIGCAGPGSSRSTSPAPWPAASRVPEALGPVAAARVAVDFERDDLPTRLDAVGFDPARPVLFLWEGADDVHRRGRGRADARLRRSRGLRELTGLRLRRPFGPHAARRLLRRRRGGPPLRPDRGAVALRGRPGGRRLAALPRTACDHRFPTSAPRTCGATTSPTPVAVRRARAGFHGIVHAVVS